jgi:hypothetical protein
MFGNQDDQSSQQNTDIPDESIHGVLNDGSSAPTEQPTMTVPAPAADQPGDQSWQHPGLPINNAAEPISDIITPVAGTAPSPASAMSGPPLIVPGDDASIASTEELVNIKQKALGELSPLIDQLDQPPEDRFRTMMMLIQASDNQSLVKEAYAAAHAIPDEKVRAQALLDIVNEINYFTQHQTG